MVYVVQYPDAFGKVTAEGIDPHTTTVSQVMTRGPMVTRDTTSATEALQLMVERHFRHLVRYFRACSHS
jgi:CBS domain-containing protein